MKQILSLAIPALLLSACSFDAIRCIKGEGSIITQDINVSAGFSEIELAMDADVYLHKDSVYRVSVEAQDNLAEAIEFDRFGNHLKIETDRCIREISSQPIRIDIYLPSVDELILDASGNIEMVDSFANAGELLLRINGSGDIQGKGSVNALRTEINGSGDIRFIGSATDANTRITGSGNFDWSGSGAKHTMRIDASGNIYTYGAPVQEAEVQVSGSGNIETQVSDKLSVKISGSGNVRYKGLPAVDVSITGSGKLIHE